MFTDVPELPESIEQEILFLRYAEPNTINERIEYMIRYSTCYDSFYEWCLKNRHNSLLVNVRDHILGNQGKPTSTTQKNYIIKLHGYRCVICNLKIPSFLAAHHIIPRHLGGNTQDANLIPVCSICHKILHMLEYDTQIPVSVDRHIKRNKLIQNLYEYTAHLECDYFSNVNEKESIPDLYSIDYWLGV